ncbi:MAG: hypothetical protein ACI9HI_001707, partial [Salinirussus sp.]
MSRSAGVCVIKETLTSRPLNIGASRFVSIHFDRG